jgi:hypothetical protein
MLIIARISPRTALFDSGLPRLVFGFGGCRSGMARKVAQAGRSGKPLGIVVSPRRGQNDTRFRGIRHNCFGRQRIEPDGENPYWQSQAVGHSAPDAR